jgi:hypothetical protein
MQSPPKRSGQQNKLYHSLCSDLKLHKTITVWDGRFNQYGYPNPFKINPRSFSYDTFRELMKALDWEYTKDDQGRPLSSAKISIERMNSHIAFLEVLLMEMNE